MSDIIFAPKSPIQNQWETSVRHREFRGGMVNDGPSVRIPDNALRRIINHLNRIGRLDARQGCKQWSTASINDLALYTGYTFSSTVSSSTRTITKTAGTNFASTMVDKWFVFDNGVAELIKGYTSTTVITTYTQRSSAISGTAGKVRDKCYGGYYHEKQRKVVVQVGGKMYVSSDVNVTAWTQAYCDTEDALSEEYTIFDEFNNFVFFANGSTIYKMDLSATPYLFFAVNVPIPTVKITGNQTLMNAESYPYWRRYIYGMLRTRYSSTGHHDRETSGVTIERESGTTAFAKGSGATRITVVANATTDKFTATAHGLVDNQLVRLDCSLGGRVPGGFSETTPYYVIWVDANTFQLSTYIDTGPRDIVDAGSGTIYVVPNTESDMDYGEVWTAKPVGDDALNASTYGLVSGGQLVSPHDTPNGWSVYEDARFRMTMNGVTTDVKCDFTNCKTMGEVATKIQAALRSAFAGSEATCVHEIVSKMFTPDHTTDYITLESGHGLANTNMVMLVSTGTLPTGLSQQTPYYIINLSTNSCQLSLTSGGAAVTFSDNGSGTHYAVKNGSAGRFKVAAPTIGGKVSRTSRPVACTAFTVDTVNDYIVLTAHGYAEDDLVSFSSTTTLPTGLVANKRYYVLYVDANNFQVAETIGGTKVDITDSGTGTHYVLHGGFDVSTYLGLSSSTPSGTVSTPKFYTSSIVGKLQLPQDSSSNIQAHDNFYAVYSTLDIGVHGIDPVSGNGNNSEVYVWNCDVPVANALVVSSAQFGALSFTLLTATKGTFYVEDVGSTLVFSDGDKAVIGYLCDAAGTAVAGSSVYAMCVNGVITNTAKPAAIGDERDTPLIGAYQCSQSGTTVTWEAGTAFTAALVGKKLYWQDFSTSYVVSYTDATHVVVADSTTRASLACASDPHSRRYCDAVNDDVLRSRVGTYPADQRFYDPLPASNIVAMCPGLMAVASRDGSQVSYSPMPKGFEYYAGYYYAANHYLTVKDKIQHLFEHTDCCIILCSNSTHTFATNQLDATQLKDVGITISQVTGQSARDKAIGISHFSAACKAPIGGLIVITNEPGLRIFDGSAYQQNVAEGKVGDILKKAKRIYSIGYDQITGLNFWLNTDVNRG